MWGKWAPEGGEKRKGERKREEKKGEFRSEDSVVTCVP
jgi:hypothetical protein